MMIDHNKAVTPTIAAHRWTWGIPWVVAVVSGLAYLATVRHGFVCWDDDHNFTWNLDFGPLSWNGIVWAWTTFRAGVYQPLAWMVLEAEANLWGLDPRGYHAVNVAFHAINAAVVYRLILAVLERCRPSASRREADARRLAAGLATLLFAVHPLRVEVVAWASCQPYLPSIFCASLATIAYLRSHPSDGTMSPGWLVVSWSWFVMAILFKAEAATLPALFVILDVYPLRRIGPWRWLNWRIWAEKLPFFVATIVILGIATRARGVADSNMPAQSYDFIARLAQACYSACFYLFKTAWPTDLQIYYGLPERIEITAWPFWPTVVAVVIVSLGAFLLRRQFPALMASWLAYLTCLSLHLGFVTTGPVIAADRYCYLATIPLAILLAGGLARVLSSWSRLRGVIVAVGLAVSVALAGLTWDQCRQWRDAEILLKSALAGGGSRSAEIRSALGLTLKRSGELDEAATLYEEALRIAPDYFQAHFYLGVIRGEQGQFAEAERHLRAAEKIDPDDRDAQFNLAVSIARQGRIPEAIGHFQRALKILPQAEDAFNLALLLSEQGRLEEAADAYRMAVKLRPDHAPTHNNLGAILVALGKFAEAEAQFREALRIQPGYANARRGLDLARQKQGLGS